MIERLPNGLRLVLAENPSAQVVALQAWVQVGSADEGPGEEGLAHLHEHLLFKGTGRRAPGEIARDVEARGGEINAWTSHDQTVYHLVLASRFLAEGLDVLSDALRHAAFDPVELQREIEVVIEEIHRSQDQPGRRLSRELFDLAYQRHPYQRPVLGTEASVRGLDRSRVLGFYQRHYRADQIVLVVHGDLDRGKALAEIERYFGGAWGSGPAPEAQRSMEPEQLKARARVRSEDIQEAYLSLGFHIPGLRHPDVPALDLLAVALGQGESSRLAENVKRERGLANEISTHAYTPKDPGMLIASATLAAEHVAQALPAMLREFERLKEDRIGPDELAQCKQQIDSEAIYQQETAQGWARKLGFYAAAAGSLEYEQEYRARVAETIADELREVAREVFDARHLSTVCLWPRSESGAVTEEQVLAWSEEGLRGVAARRTPRVVHPSRPGSAPPPPATRGEPGGGLRRSTLTGGGTLLIQHDTSVPVFAIRAAFPGGLRYESAAQGGIGSLLSRMLTKGAAGRGAQDIARAVDGMAGAIGGTFGRNSFGLRGDFLSRRAEEALELFFDCLLEPNLAAEELEKERTLQLQEIASREDHPTSVVFELFARTLYRTHPYRLSISGERESVLSIAVGDLAEALGRIAAQPPILSVCGDVDPVLVERLIARRLPGVRGKAVPLVAPSEEAAPDAPRRAELFLDKAQAHLIVGFLGLRLADPRRDALEVLSAVLSGQGGRLFVGLRDQQSLAYSVSGNAVEGVDPGYFAIYLGTSPDKFDRALAGVSNELDRLRQEEVSAVELARAQSYLVGTRAIALQRRSAVAGVLALDELVGLGADFHRHYSERITAVTAAQVQSIAQTLLEPKGEVVAAVRPRPT
jgi:zinc protease